MVAGALTITLDRRQNSFTLPLSNIVWSNGVKRLTFKLFYHGINFAENISPRK
jgi:hypothetical protein